MLNNHRAFVGQCIALKHVGMRDYDYFRHAYKSLFLLGECVASGIFS